MKKIVIICAIICVNCLYCLYCLSYSVCADNVEVKLNNKTIQCDAQPFIKNGRTLVPIRAITESMGCFVEWNQDTQTAIISNDKTSIFIEIGSKEIYVFDLINKTEKSISIDVEAQIYQERTFVPLRVISESFGANVGWDEDTYTVFITYPNTENENIKSINFSDKAFEYSVRKKLGCIDDDKTITTEMLNSITHLDLLNCPDGTKLTSIKDMNKLPNIATISVDKEIDKINDFALLADENKKFKDFAFEICVRMDIAHAYRDFGNREKIYVGNITDDMLTKVANIYSEYLPSFMKMSSLEDLKLVPNVKRLELNDERTEINDYSDIQIIEEWEELDLQYLEIKDDYFLDNITVTKAITFPNLGETNSDTYYRDEDRSYKETLRMYKYVRDGLTDIENRIGNNSTDYNKFKIIHDYIILNMAYDYDEFEDSLNGEYIEKYDYWRATNMHQLFETKKGVCLDYAMIYSKICTYFGLECWYVCGKADGVYGWVDHMWNIVKLDGKYYHVDPTWDDVDEGTQISYNYFLVSDEKTKMDHAWGEDNMMKDQPEYLREYMFRNVGWETPEIKIETCKSNY